ncbi:uncharacterized protein LOC143817469 [Ranitomeya variabilis]|uniref:uncharacterized protein LOC143817469 n=1 Tax=Ranitomeya variabilis TaxID=490064 RepID=UPI004057B2A8
MSHPQRCPQVPAARSCQSLTGCFYQVVQTTGPLGTNVLNLLPILRPKDKPIPAAPPAPAPSAPVLNVPPAVLSSPAPPQHVLSHSSPVSVPLVQTPTLGNYIISAQGNTLHVENQFPVYQEATLFLDRGQLTLPSNSVPGKPPTFIMVNTKPANPIKPMPKLPSGHSLQIPSHAEVLSVPISSLPFSIQQKILPQARVSDVSKVPSVIYVSPVNTVKSAQSSQSNPSPDTKSPSQSRPPTGVSEALKGPMQWVVQEDQESASCVVPVKSSNDTASKILQKLTKTKMEDVNVTIPDRSKVMQIKDNALVMCNNKIFFLTKKGTEIINTGPKIPEPPQFATPEKHASAMKPMNELSNQVVQVVLAKNKSPSPGSEMSVQSNVVSTAKPKRKSSTPRAVRSDPSVLYMSEDSGSNVSRELWGAPPSAASSSPSAAYTLSRAVGGLPSSAGASFIAAGAPSHLASALSRAAGGSTCSAGTPSSVAGAPSRSASALSRSAGGSPCSAGAPSSAVGALYSVAGAPSSAVGVPYSVAGAPASAVGAPYSAVGAPYSAVGARYSAAGAPSSAVRAISSAAGAPSSAVGAPYSAAGAPSSAAGAPSSAVGAPFSAVRAPYSAAGAPSSAVGAPYSAAGAPSSAVGAPYSTAGAPTRVAGTPSSAASTFIINAANIWDTARKTDQPLPKSQKTEIATSPEPPEAQGTDERSWRLKFGLLKKEKIILKRIPLIRAAGTSGSNASPPGESGSSGPDPAETPQKQPKRKSSQSENDTKVQKRWESDDVNHSSPDPEVSDSPSSPVPEVTTPESHSTWSHQGAYDPSDFQVSPESAGHFSDILLPRPRFHIDSMYPDETTKDEKIQRLKEVLKEREDAVEALRRQNM